MEYMTTSEVARLAKVAETTVRWWERTGKLSAERTASGLRLFARPEVEQLVRDRAKKQRGRAKKQPAA